MMRPGRRRRGPGGWVFNIGGWAHQQFADDPEAVHARGAGSDRAGQSRRAAGVLLPGLPEQPGAEGVRDRGGRARPDGLRQGIDHARRGRQADRRDQGRHRRDASGGRQAAEGRARTARGEQPGAGQGHESRRPHVVRRGRLQRRRARDLPEVEGAGPSERPGLLHRRRRGRHAGAGGPIHPADRAR